MVLPRILFFVCSVLSLMEFQSISAFHELRPGPIALRVSSLSPGEVDALLDVHNAGRADTDPTAANMNQVTWSHTLYAAAKEKVETCQYVVDIPQETGHFGDIVQFTGISRRSPFVLVDAIETWFEVGKASYDFYEDTCSSNPMFCKMYKLFTWGPMTSIGCAYTLCEDLYDTYTERSISNTYYWKCNYFPIGIIDDAAAYTPGTPCINCPSGTGWCNSEYDMCDDTCNVRKPTCDCLYNDTCTGVYDYDPRRCMCTCNHEDCRDDDYVCILKCGDPAWTRVDNEKDICECECPEGYETNEVKDICNDIDECLDRGRCDHFCDNTPGSYECSCMHGFELDTDQRTCVPFFQLGRHEELREATSTSQPTPTTEFEETTFVPELTTEERTTEPPTTEEETTTGCPTLDCSGEGSYNPVTCICDCNKGYEFSEEAETCEDINECLTNDTGCIFCKNLPGTFRCLTCPDGQQLNNVTGLCVPDVCDLGEDMFCSGKGDLDETTCKCSCDSGYKGKACKSVCNVKEVECWPKHKPKPPTDPSQCEVFCPECECLDYPSCQHNGTLAKVEGFEYVRGGLCRCYCPQPWSGALCTECNLMCQNGATLVEDDCRCSCPDGWYGIDCSTPCVEKSMLCTSKTADLCGDVAIIDKHCPIMCNLCKPSDSESEISGSGEIPAYEEMYVCDETVCDFGGVCRPLSTTDFECVCRFNCPAIRYPVCGTNDLTYASLCQLSEAACQQQSNIILSRIGTCEDVEMEPCDGDQPLMRYGTSELYNCTADNGGEDCPSGSYCHIDPMGTFNVCCGGEPIMEM